MFGLKKVEKKLIEKILKKYKNIEKVLVFGSRVKNTHSTYSDIDLCIFSHKLDEIEFTKLKNDFEESNLIYKVDIVLFSEIENENFKKRILEEGKEFLV